MKRTGVVKWFDDKIGYGFIVNPDGQDVFLHYSRLPGTAGSKSAQKGDMVVYTEVESDKGLRASHVHELRRC